jgi:hypothetical protein
VQPPGRGVQQQPSPRQATGEVSSGTPADYLLVIFDEGAGIPKPFLALAKEGMFF